MFLINLISEDILDPILPYEALVFQGIAATNRRLDNYFNNLPQNANIIRSEAHKLSTIHRQQMQQIKDTFSTSLKISLMTPAIINTRQKNLENKIRDLERAIKDKNKSFEKLKSKSQSSGNNVNHNLSSANQKIFKELEKYNLELQKCRSQYRNPPRPESRNEVLGQAVKGVLFPASYDYVLRIAKYSVSWSLELDKNKLNIENINSNIELENLEFNKQKEKSLENPYHTRHNSQPYLSKESANELMVTSSSSSHQNYGVKANLRTMPDCLDRKEFKSNIQGLIKELQKLEIVDKPD